MGKNTREALVTRRERYLRLKAEGKCTRCQAPVFDGKTICAECREKAVNYRAKNKEYNKKRHREEYLIRVRNGICVCCKNDAVPGRVNCQRHIEEAKKRRQS